jgi:UTP--glucose-1-phosphate uridylyltransferase
VACAQHLIDDEPFAVILPDDLIDGGGTGCLEQMLAIYHQTAGSVLAVEQMPVSQLHHYGVIAAEDVHVKPMRIQQIIEKPTTAQAPSNWTVVGRYILTPEVMRQLAQTKPSVGGEIQLTDAINASLATVPTYGLPFVGKRFDCGGKKGFLEANIHYGLSQTEEIFKTD